VTKDGDTTVVAEKRRRRWLGFLEKAGGAWAEAGRQVMASATVSSPSRTASA